MKRALVAIAAVIVGGIGVWQCTKEDTGSNPLPATVDITGTWRSDVVYLSADTTFRFEASFVASPAPACSLKISMGVAPIVSFLYVVYKDYGSWSIVGDSVKIARLSCMQINPMNPVQYLPVTCEPATGSVKISIAGTVWAVPVADLDEYLPRSFVSASPAGEVLELTKQ